jgi:hypothetical protein
MRASIIQPDRRRRRRPYSAAALAAVVLAACAAPPDNPARRWIGFDALPEAGGSGGAAGARIDDPSPPGRGGQAGTGGQPGTGGSPASAGTGGTGGASPLPPADAAAAADVPPSPPPSGPPVACSLEVTVTTASTDFDYAPRNIGALWIEDTGGRFVKTLALWAARRVIHLDAWLTSTGAAGVSRNTVDAVTGATVRTHVAHTGTWDCTNAKKALVPQGMYQLCVEMTESNAPGPKHCVPFSNTGKEFDLVARDTPNFKARRLVYTPR